MPLDKLVMLVMLEDTELLGQCVLSFLYEKSSSDGGEMDLIMGMTRSLLSLTWCGAMLVLMLG